MEHNTAISRLISGAVAESRRYDKIATVQCNDWELAMEYLKEMVDEDEDYDSVENGDVLEFWAYNSDDSMTFRVHVARVEHEYVD